MKKVIRLTESDLVRLVKRVLTESNVNAVCLSEMNDIYDLFVTELMSSETAVKYKRPDIRFLGGLKQLYNGDEAVICSKRFEDWRNNVLNDHYKSNPDVLECIRKKVAENCKSGHLQY